MGVSEKRRFRYPPNMGDESSKMPKKRPKIIQKYEEIVRLVHKKRRNVNSSGCMRDLNRVCCDIRFRKSKSEDIS